MFHINYKAITHYETGARANMNVITFPSLPGLTYNIAIVVNVSSRAPRCL